jgi:hypothetical protein
MNNAASDPRARIEMKGEVVLMVQIRRALLQKKAK